MKRVGEIGPQLLATLGIREHGKGPGPTEAADKRARAFALLAHAYDQTRRAVAYLRWNEGDAETIAPSIYKSRGGRATGASDDGAEPDDGEDPTAPTGPDAPPPVAGTAPIAAPPGPGPQALPGTAPAGAPAVS